jgi:hypothetical protein
MKVVLFIGSVLVGLIALAMWAGARSAIHEATGAALLVSASVLFGAAAIVDAIEQLGRKLIPKESGKVPELRQTVS